MHVLRFDAQLVSTEPDDETRRFIVSFYNWRDIYVKVKENRLKQERLRVDSIVKIQRVIRGYLGRKIKKRRKISQKIMVRGMRMMLARGRMSKIRENMRRQQEISHMVECRERFRFIYQYYRVW
jgi:hypothetical protein